MKIVFWLLPVVVLIGIGVRFWLQRRREQKAQKDGRRSLRHSRFHRASDGVS